jgi:hypothetical protein
MTDFCSTSLPIQYFGPAPVIQIHNFDIDIYSGKHCFIVIECYKSTLNQTLRIRFMDNDRKKQKMMPKRLFYHEDLFLLAQS